MQVINATKIEIIFLFAPASATVVLQKFHKFAPEEILNRNSIATIHRPLENVAA
jgi:hypothetical protein